MTLTESNVTHTTHYKNVDMCPAGIFVVNVSRESRGRQLGRTDLRYVCSDRRAAVCGGTRSCVRTKHCEKKERTKGKERRLAASASQRGPFCKVSCSFFNAHIEAAGRQAAR